MVAVVVVVVVVVLPLVVVVVVRLQSIRDAAKASRSFSSWTTREWCMLMDIDLRKNNDLAVYLAVTSYVLVAYAHVWCRQWILDRVADRKKPEGTSSGRRFGLAERSAALLEARAKEL